jgi:tRNA_anti-like
MALASCKECKKEVSSLAATCPHCGVKNPAKGSSFKVLLYTVGSVLVVGMCATAISRKNAQTHSALTGIASTQTGGSSVTPSAAVDGAPPEPTATTIVLSKKEESMLGVLLADDLDVFAQGGESVFGRSTEAKEYVVTTADKFQREYEKNEVAGDKQFRGQAMILRGKVASIDRSLGENYFVSLRGGTNMFMGPKAKMADGHVDYMANLKKGQTIQLLCKGDGMLMGSAIASGCQPYQLWRDAKVDELLASVPAHAQARDKATLGMLTIAIAVAPKLSETSTCGTDRSNRTCRDEISRAVGTLAKSNTKSRSEFLDTLAARLQIPRVDLESLLKREP